MHIDLSNLDCTPITDEELGDLIDRARDVIRSTGADHRMLLALQARRDEVRHRALVELEDLYSRTPWWNFRQRFFIRRVIESYLPGTPA